MNFVIGGLEPPYIKDSSDYLVCLENVKSKAEIERWDWENTILFTIDVKALYPSVKFGHMRKALTHAFSQYTLWPEEMKNIIVDLTIYTLENQQIRWNSKFYLLSQGLPTGAKHSVPLANIFLSFIMLEGLKNSELKNMFNSRVKLCKRFIDDCTGIFQGSISEFTCFFLRCYKVPSKNMI